MKGYRGAWFKDRQRSVNASGRELGEAECTVQTRKAILVKRDDGEMWIPQVAVHASSEVRYRGQTGKLVVKTWWAEARGM